MPKYGAPGTPEALAAEKHAREEATAIERRRWWELRETYARCVEIAEQVWGERLDAAQAVQQKLAEQMRDREAEIRTRPSDFSGYIGGPVSLDLLDRSIPVPLFTPRDRQQFLKEAATTLLISADRRNLPVTREAKRETTEAPQAADGVAEQDADVEAGELDAAGQRPDEPLPVEAQSYSESFSEAAASGIHSVGPHLGVRPDRPGNGHTPDAA